MRRLNVSGRVKVLTVLISLSVALAAIFYFGAMPIRSWHMPDVAILQPADGEDVSGAVAVTASYSVGAGNVHTMQTLIDGQVADSVAVHQSAGTYVFAWNSRSVSDGPHTIEVRAYTAAAPSTHFNSKTISVNVLNAACSAHADCDDSDAYTEDICNNPGQADAACVYNAIACLNAADCDDSDDYTLDACAQAGTSASSCQYVAIACLNAADCDDGDALTIDTCANGGAASAVCVNAPIVCNTNADCDDGDAMTLDNCRNPGGGAAACVNMLIACYTDADCDDADAYTQDICLNGGMGGAACANNAIACINNADCDDGDDLTLDVCQIPGVAAAVCLNTPIACNTNSDCDDADTYTQDVCANGGTAGSACANNAIECLNDADCDDSDVLTLDACANPGSATASCAHDPLECGGDEGCDDGNEFTIDACVNPGAAASRCTHTAVACFVNADCDDANADTQDICTSPGAPGAACVHNVIACANDGGCDDADPLTLDACVNPGTPDAACAHTVIACVTDADCDDADAGTADACVNPGTVQAVCQNVTVQGPDEPQPGDPVLDVMSPEDALLTNAANVLVAGKATPGAAVTVNDAAADVDAAGAFSMQIQINEGNNIICIKACLSGECVTETRSAFLDTHAPEIGDAAVEDTAIYIAVRDNAGGCGLDGEALIVMLDGDEFATVFDQARKALRVIPGDLKPGSHIATVSAADLAGNTAQGVVRFVFRANRGMKIVFTKLPGAEVRPSDPAPQVAPGGAIEAQVVLQSGSAPDPDSVVVTLDGAVLDHTFDADTLRVTAVAEPLSEGEHVLEVEAADTEGLVTMAATTFDALASSYVYSIDFTNINHVSHPDPSELAVGDEFRVAFTMEGAPPQTPYAVLYNATDAGDPPDVENHGIGLAYAMQLVSQTGTTYEYQATNFIYTSRDQSGLDAQQIAAAIWIGDSQAGHLTGGPVLNTLDIDNNNNGVLRPALFDVILANATNPSFTFTLNLGDSYRVDASGSRGLQDVLHVLANIDTLRDPLSQGQGLQAAAIAKIDPQSPLFEPMAETSYGSGHYDLEISTLSGTADTAVLETMIDGAGRPARALVSVLCSPLSGIACVFGNVMYAGLPQDKPNVFQTALYNDSGEPYEPFTSGSRDFRVEVRTGNLGIHAPYLKARIMNADPQFLSADPLAWAEGLQGSPLPAHMQYSISPFVEDAGEPGLYVAHGTFNEYTDEQGRVVESVIAVTTISEFFEDNRSNVMSVDANAQPPTPVPMDYTALWNVTDPDTRTVVENETVRIEARPGEGWPAVTGAELYGACLDGSGTQGAMAVVAMVESEPGLFTGQVQMPARPLCESGQDVQLVIVNLLLADGGAYMVDEILTWRESILAVHMSNDTRPGATDIAPGETLRITAHVAAAPSDDLAAILTDAVFYHSLAGDVHGAILGELGALAQDPLNPGQYYITTPMPAVAPGVFKIRCLAGSFSEPAFPPVMSTEVLDVISVPAPAATTIASIAGVNVADAHVTAPEAQPEIAGAAPANTTVTIYELTPGGSIGTLTGAAAPAAVLMSPQNFIDDFNDQGRSDNLWSFGAFSKDDSEYRTQIVNGAVEIEPRNDPAWLESQGPLSAPADFSLQFDIQLPDITQSGSNSLRFGTRAPYQSNNMFQIYWFGDGRIQIENQNGVQTTVQHTPPAPGALYPVRVDYSDSAHTLTMSIGGAVAVVSDPAFFLSGSDMNLIFSINLDSGGGQIAILDNVSSTLAMPGGYVIDGPALGIDGGPVYDALATGYGMLPTDGEPLFANGVASAPGVDGSKDIYAALVRLFNVRTSDTDPPLVEAGITFYSAGDPSNPSDDQIKTIRQFLEGLQDRGDITGYIIDAAGVVLQAQGQGLSYLPGAMSAQSAICASQPGTPPSLIWDAAQNTYLGSYTPLKYDGAVYSDYLVWGPAQGADAPNIIYQDNAPIWWADASANISAAVLCSTSQGWCGSAYGPEDMFAQLVGGSDPELLQLAERVLLAPAALGGDYIYDPAPLAAAGMEPYGPLTCAGYGRVPIANTTADSAGTYQVTIDNPFATSGDHLLYAESTDPAGNPMNNSNIVTYTLQTAQTITTTITTIDNQSVAAGAPAGSDYTPRVCGAAPAGETVTLILIGDNSAETPVGSATALADNTFCLDVDSATPLPQGENTLVARTPGQTSAPATYILEMDLPGAAHNASEWPKFRANNSNTGSTSATLNLPLQLNWKTSLGDSILSSPAVAGGKVFVGSYDNYSYALDRDTGDIAWRVNTFADALSSPTLAGGNVYQGSYSARMFSINQASGVTNAIYNYPGCGIVSSPVTHNDDKIIFGCATSVGANKILALPLPMISSTPSTYLDLLLWSVDTASPYGTHSSPALVDGVIYIGTHSGQLLALMAQDKQEVWTAQTLHSIYGAPAVAYGRVYFGNISGAFYALDKNTGAIDWQVTLDSGVRSSAAVAYGIVFIQSMNGTLYALDERTGDPVWPEIHFTGTNNFSSPVVADGKLIIGSMDNKIHILDIAGQGAQLAELETGGEIHSTPAVVDGTIYAGSYDGFLYAFGPGDDEDPPVITDITIDPTAISPTVTGDLFDTTRITAAITDASSFGWILIAQDANTLNELELDFGTDSNIDFTWDGSENGAPLADGMYNIIITARDFSGNGIESRVTAPQQIQIDNAPPSVAIQTPAANEFVGGSLNVTVLAQDPQPGTGVSEVTVWADGLPPVAAQATGNPNEYTATLDISQPAQGPLTIFAQAKDIVENHTDAQVETIKDTQAPVVTITLAEPQYFTKTNPLVINAGIQDANSSNAWTLTITDSNTVPVYTINGTGDAIDATWNGTDTNTAAGAPLPDGEYTITITTTDLAGKTGQQTAAATLDNTPPAILITVPQIGDAFGPQTHTAEFAIADTALAPSSVICMLAPYDPDSGQFGDPLAGVAQAPIYQGGDSWTCELNIALIDASLTHRFTVSAQDTAGNNSTKHVSVFVDTVAPVIKNMAVQWPVISPSNTTSENVKDFAVVTANVQDDNAGNWTVTVQNELLQTVKTFTGSGSDISVAWLGDDENTSFAGDGPYTVRINASDAAGTPAQEVTIAILVDNETPLLSMQPQETGILKGALHPIIMTATDNDEIETVEFRDDFSEPVFVTRAADGAYIYDWSSADLSHGDYTLYSKATDRAGNNVTTSITVSVANTFAPDVEITSPDSGSEVSGRDAPIHVSFSTDKGRVRDVSLLIDGVVIAGIAPGPQETEAVFLLDTTLYKDGVYTLTAQALQGNVSGGHVAVSEPVQIVINNGPPAITFLEPVPFAALQAGPITIRATVTSPAQIPVLDENITVLVEELLNGSPQQSWEPDFTLANGEITAAIDLADAEYRITITAADTAGNTANAEQRFFVGLTLLAEPESFNPSSGESITLKYMLPQDALVTLTARCLDCKSTTLIKIRDHEQQAAGWKEIPWDGTDQSGTVIPDGGYSFEITAYVSGSGYITYAKPNTAPEASILNVEANGVNRDLDMKEFVNWNLSQKALVNVHEDSCSIGTKTVRLAGVHRDEVDIRSCNGKLDFPVTETGYEVYPVKIPWNAVVAHGNAPVVDGPTVYPHRVNPDQGETSPVSFTLSQDAFVTVKILNGSLGVERVFMDRAWRAADGNALVFQFDALAADAAALPTGPYEVLVVTEDAQGNQANARAVAWSRRNPSLIVADNVLRGNIFSGENVTLTVNGQPLEAHIPNGIPSYTSSFEDVPGTYVVRAEIRDAEKPDVVYVTEVVSEIYDWRGDEQVIVIYPEEGEIANFKYTLRSQSPVLAMMNTHADPRGPVYFKTGAFEDQGEHSITWNGRDSFGDYKYGSHDFMVSIATDTWIKGQMAYNLVKHVRVLSSIFIHMGDPKVLNVDGIWRLQFDNSLRPTKSHIKWGPDTTYGSEYYEQRYEKYHDFPLGQLEDGVYHFKVEGIALFGIKGYLVGTFSIPDGKVTLTRQTGNGHYPNLVNLSATEKSAALPQVTLSEAVDAADAADTMDPDTGSLTTDMESGRLDTTDITPHTLAYDFLPTAASVSTQQLSSAPFNPYKTYLQAGNCPAAVHDHVKRNKCRISIDHDLFSPDVAGDGFWTYDKPVRATAMLEYQIDRFTCPCKLNLCNYSYLSRGSSFIGPYEFDECMFSQVIGIVDHIDIGVNHWGQPYIDYSISDDFGKNDPHDGAKLADVISDRACEFRGGPGSSYINNWTHYDDYGTCDGSTVSHITLRGYQYTKNFVSRVHAPEHVCWNTPLRVTTENEAVWGFGSWRIWNNGLVEIDDVSDFTIDHYVNSSLSVELWDRAGNDHMHSFHVNPVRMHLKRYSGTDNGLDPITVRVKSNLDMISYANPYEDKSTKCPSAVWLENPSLGTLTVKDKNIDENRCQTTIKFKGRVPGETDLCAREPLLGCETCRKITVACMTGYVWDPAKEKCVRDK